MSDARPKYDPGKIEPERQAAWAEARAYDTPDPEEGQHIEIWDHWADALMALGKTREAVDVWQKGLKFEDLSKRDVDRRRKVSEKLRDARE